jgi:hypothetical protein
MILPSLRNGRYAFTTQQVIGTRIGGGKHIVDVIAEKDGKKYLISLKWQQVSGTAEQKVPFEVLCLTEAVIHGAFDKAYLVLGGNGWKLRDFYTRGGLEKYLAYAEKVHITTLESFVALANQGKV